MKNSSEGSQGRGLILDITITHVIIINSNIIINNDNIVKIDRKEISMPSRKADLMLHPLRLRNITAISGSRMTAKDLAEIISDVPQATLYRHINALTEGEILKVVEENPVRGTLERVYALAEPPSLQPEDLQGMTKQDYEQAFTVFLTTCMSDARRYLNSKAEGQPINLLADGVMVSKAELNLSDDEFSRLNQEISGLLLSAFGNQPAPGRKRRVMVYLAIPVG
jgi:DNA-binding transcriptional ArsR family regulator